MDGFCRLQCRLYNAALEERSSAWWVQRTSITRLDQKKSLTAIRGFDPEYRAQPVTMARWTLA